MREIKFRVWDNKNRKWLLGYEYENLGGFSLWGEMVIMGEWSNAVHNFLFERAGYKWEDLVVMQYTGLKDKDGKEIYEGDLFHIETPPKEDNWVEYYEGEWMLYPHGLRLPDWYNVGEVIGNIYENPELLKGGVEE